MSTGRGRAPLVGRAPELKTLERRLAEAAAGDGGLLCIGGEAGVGKTRLATELVAIAATEGTTTAWATCNPDAPAFWPWRQLLRAVGGTNPVEQVAGDGPAAADRFALFDSVTERLRGAASDAPALLVFDDLQWADAPSLRLLAFAVRELRRAPVLVLGTYRDTDLAAAHDLHDVIGELGPAVSVLRLGGLDVDAVSALLVDRLGDRGHGLADAVHARTGGNPFFIRELAHALEREPDERVDEVPRAVVSLMQRQLDACSPACRDLLAAAAVARTFDADAPATALEEALAARLVRTLDDGSYAFAHDIVRDAVLASLSAARRAELHWARGTRLRDLPRHTEEAARHLEAGVAAGTVAIAIEAALDAARQASATFAFEVAVDHLQWVLAHANGDAPVDTITVELMLGDALGHTGDWDAAGAVFERAAAAARAADRPDDLARAALGFGAGLGGFEVRMVDTRQLALLEEASAALTEDSALASFVRSRWSVALSFVDEPERRRALAHDALAMAERVGDAAAHAHALAAWCDTIAGPAHTEERLQAATDIMRLAREAGNPELVLVGHRHRVLAFLELGAVTRATREVGAFERAAARHPVPIATWYVPLWRGMLALLHGDRDAATRFADEAGAMGDRAGSDNAVLLVGTLRQWIAVSGGGFPAWMLAVIHEYADPVLEVHPQLLSPRGPFLLAAAMVSDERTAREHLDAVVTYDYGDPEDSEWLGTLVAATEAVFMLRDREIASALAQRLRPYCGRLVVDGIGAAVIGVVDEYVGALECFLGVPDGPARIDTAIATYERVRAPLLAARARARLGPEAPSRTATVARTSTTGEHGELVREGAVWRFSFAGTEVRVRDVKGVRDLALLLARPGEEVHVSALVGGDVVAAAPGAVVLDERAKREYRHRITELEAEIDDARAANDDERAARAEAELDVFVTELTRAVGLRGRDRRAPDAPERARQAVRARVRWAIDRVAADHAALGRHLDASVRTGTFCSYRPERPTTWDVRP